MNAPSELKSTNCDLFFTIESIERVAIAISFSFSFFPLTPLFTLKPFRNITSLHFNARFEGIHKLLRNFMQLFLVIKIFLKSIHYKRHAFWFSTSQKSNTFVEIIQNIIGIAKIWNHDKQIRSPSCYSVDSIKRTVLLKVLLLKETSKNLYQKYCLLLVNSIFNREKSPWKAKCTVRLIESTE